MRSISLQHMLRQTGCEVVDLGQDNLNCDLQEVLVYVLYQEAMINLTLFLECAWG